MRLGTVRRFTVLAKATTLEILSEPLSLLLLSAALVLAVLAPALHYHQFGEVTRMARDSGFSALLIGGFVFAAAGTLRSFRREIEGGTASAALAHPVSRGTFFLAKCAGSAFAFALFAVTVGSVTLVTVRGAAIGGEIAAKTFDIPKLYGPCLAVGVAAIVAPYPVAAALNRFARCRFALSAFLCSAAIAFAGSFLAFDPGLWLRLAPGLALVWFPPLMLIAVAGAASVRLKANAAGAVSALAVAAFLPFAGNYCLSEALSRGGSIPLGYVALAFGALASATLAFLLIGISLFNGKDIS